jgi:hypothetical protein
MQLPVQAQCQPESPKKMQPPKPAPRPEQDYWA